MTSLTRFNGQAYMVPDEGSPVPISDTEYQQQIAMQEQTQGMDKIDRFGIGYGRAQDEAISGFKQLVTGNDNAEAQYRQQLQEGYQPMQDYGGWPAQAGEFVGSGITGLLPGKFTAQGTIGAIQGAAEMPDSPWTGAAAGVAGTLLGEWAGNAVNRIGKTLFGKRQEADAYIKSQVKAGQDAGMRFTPGQVTDNIPRKKLEQELMKTPQFAAADMDRFLHNRTNLNNLAARYLGETPTGRVTPQMLDNVYQKAKEGFKVLDDYDGPITMDRDAMQAVVGDLSEQGKQFFRTFVGKNTELINGNATNQGKAALKARNWLAKQSRNSANMQAGLGDDISAIMGVLDDSIEGSVDDIMLPQVARARNKWKAMLVAEGSLRGAEGGARGDISPAGAYQSLKKYYGRNFTQGRVRDPFMDSVRSLNAVGDTMPGGRVSANPLDINPAQGIMQLPKQMMVDSYMDGSVLSEVLLGMTTPAMRSPVAEKLGRGSARGLMDELTDE